MVPLGVDRALVPDRLEQVEFHGYGFDTDQSLRVCRLAGATQASHGYVDSNHSSTPSSWAAAW